MRPRLTRRLEDRGNEFMSDEEIRAIVRAAMEEYVQREQVRREELSKSQADEQQRRDSLQRQLDELTNERNVLKSRTDDAERNLAVRGELQRLGVRNVELAYRAVKDEIRRGEDGHFKGAGGEELAAFLSKFTRENPELLPARVAGGSGASAPEKVATGTLDLDKLRPGMNPEELERMRQEIARVASQTMRGL